MLSIHTNVIKNKKSLKLYKNLIYLINTYIHIFIDIYINSIFILIIELLVIARNRLSRTR